MRWIRPVVRLVLVVVALAVLAGRPIAAGPPEPRTDGLIEGRVDDGGDHRLQPPGTSDGAQPVRRSIGAPLRDPWSVGVRALWRSFGGVGGGWYAPMGSSGVPIRGSCSPSGTCSASGGGLELGRPIGPVTANRLAVQGIAFDGGRLISAGVEIGAGLDLTTHPGVGLRSVSSPATEVGGLRSPRHLGSMLDAGPTRARPTTPYSRRGHPTSSFTPASRYGYRESVPCSTSISATCGPRFMGSTLAASGSVPASAIRSDAFRLAIKVKAQCSTGNRCEVAPIAWTG